MDKYSPLLNKLTEKTNRKITLFIFGGAMALFFVMVLLLGHSHKKLQGNQSKDNNPVQFVTASHIAEFDQSATGEAIANLRSDQSHMNDQLKTDATQAQAANQQASTLEKTVEDLQNQVKFMQANQQEQQEHYQALLNQAKNNASQNINMNALGTGVGNIGRNSPLQLGFTSYSFVYRHNDATPLENTGCTPKNCILPGTFVQAVLLGAADANASVQGQSNTTPILFRILNSGTQPNGYHADLRGCFVVGEVYGDVSSERGEVKLNTISCIKNGKPISKAINGTAYDIGGKEGIRGYPVMRNGKLLAYAGGSGMLSGIGSALSQQYTTQSISPLGSTTTVDNDKVLEYGAANGAATAMDKLSSYYIQRADQFHPVIQINAGSIVDLVFLNQVQLTPDEDQSTGSKPAEDFSSHYWSSQTSNNNTVDNTPGNEPPKNLSNVHFDDMVQGNDVQHIQQQMNAMSQGDHS